MKFSILIPSKNGENYIENCVKSVLDQDYKNYEVIIGDNNNNQEFKKIISKYINLNNFKIITHVENLAVAFNWQSCLNVSSGDYIIMLGDDDCLMPNCLSILYDLISKNYNPEVISLNGIGYYNKGSLDKINHNAYTKLYFDYAKRNVSEGVLSKEKRLNIVKKMFKFENDLPLNMQPHIVSRKAISRIKKNIYQPPFPDHYALNSLLLTADSWYISYKKIVALGITNKSFGHFYFNSKIQDGINYLGHKMDFPGAIEGSVLNTCMMIWLKNIKKDYSNYLSEVKLSRSNYIHRQFFFITSQYLKSNINFITIIKFFSNLSIRDKISFMSLIFKFKLIFKGLTKLFTKEYSSFEIISDDYNIYTFTRAKKFK